MNATIKWWLIGKNKDSIMNDKKQEILEIINNRLDTPQEKAGEILALFSVVGSEFTECMKTEVSLKDGTKATVYVPSNLNATQQLDNYDQLFKEIGWWTWDKVN